MLNRDPNKSILEHFNELAVRVRRAFMWFVLACTIGYLLNSQIINWLIAPLKPLLPSGSSIVYTKPFEQIWVHIRVSMIFGFVIAAPLVLTEAFQFVNPAFKRDMKANFLALLASTLVAFAIGVWVGKEYALPAVLKVVFSFGSKDIVPFLTLSSYIDSASGLLLTCALFFEIPVLMFFLAKWGFVNAEVWKKGRKLAIVVNSIAAGILSPPDPLSMIVLMIPIFFLYELGILLASLGAKFRPRTNDGLEVG